MRDAPRRARNSLKSLLTMSMTGSLGKRPPTCDPGGTDAAGACV